MRNIKVLGSVVVILALVMLVTPLTASIVTAPKYGPTLDDLPTYAGYTYVEYRRATEDELNRCVDEICLNLVYRENGQFYEKKPQPHVPYPTNGVLICEYTKDSEAKKAYEVFYEEKSVSDDNPLAIDIGDEGVSCDRYYGGSHYQKLILFRTGRFVVRVLMDTLCEDVARITEQNIKKATASVTPKPSPTPPPVARPTPRPTPKYAPSPEELPYGLYYTSVEILTHSELEDAQKEFELEKKPFYGESTELNEGDLVIIELSDLADAERVYNTIIIDIESTKYILERDIFGDKSVSTPRGSDRNYAWFINGRFVVFIEGFDDFNLFTTLAKITDEKFDSIKAPTPTPAPPLLPISPEYFYIIPIALFLILVSLIFYARGKRKKPAPTSPEKPSPSPEQKIKEEQIPPPISKSITIERAIYDPCKRDFIEGRLPRMKEGINSYDPGAYWFAISIQNNMDKVIEEWGVELETSSALKVEKAIIEGMKYKIGLRETHPEPYKNKYAIGVPKEYGIVIPKGGAQRVYFKLRAEKPKTVYEISGVFKSAITGNVPIRAKEFKYLCDTGVSPEAVKVELKKTFSEKDAARLANTFRVVQEIRSSYCNTDTTAREINKEFDLLKMYFTEREFLDEIGGIQRRINAELREDERLDAKHVKEVKDFCEKFTEMWIVRFLR